MAVLTTEPMMIEEFAKAYEGRNFELVHGAPKERDMNVGDHGHILANTMFELTAYARKHRNGRVSGGDNCIMTEQEPDTLRGADVCFYSFERVPRGQPLPNYSNPEVRPELVIDINSPSNRPRAILAKIDEYLRTDIRIAMILDQETFSATVYRKNELPQVFDNGDTLTLPDLLPGFSVAVRSFFEE